MANVPSLYVQLATADSTKDKLKFIQKHHKKLEKILDEHRSNEYIKSKIERAIVELGNGLNDMGCCESEQYMTRALAHLVSVR